MLYRYPPIILLTLQLMGCGGGGGGASSTPDPAPPANTPPVADAGPDRTGAAGERVELDGSASSDTDGEITSWEWSQQSGPGVALQDSDTALAFFETPALEAETELAFVLTVTDDDGATDADTVSVVVRPVEQAAVFSISGTVTTSASQSADRDTNDPNSPFVPNDTLATAQPIPNPTTLGGFVSQPGAGAEGRSDELGDPDDYFRVELIRGQIITMLVADYRDADADLYLYEEDGSIVDFSIEVGEVESIEIAESGTYFINAYAFSGATNYLIAVGTSDTIPGINTAHRDIVPGQIIMGYTAKAEQKSPQQMLERVGLRQRAGGMYRPRLMTLENARERLYAHARFGTAVDKLDAMVDDTLSSRWSTLMTAKVMRREPGVAYAEANYRVRPSFSPDDRSYRQQWHYPLIDLPTAWDTTTGAPSVIVAVVDTGILPDHPDIAANLLPGYDFIRDSDRALDGDGLDPDPSDPGDEGEASNFHGTHVSGTVAAASNNGIGVAGVAPGVRLMPLRALGEDGGTAYDVSQAIRYAAGLENDSGETPSRRADIINLSLGGSGYSEASQHTMEAARAAGVIIVASAGNEATGSPQYPAAYDGVISVSAVDTQRELTSYSNFGNTVDIAAPGGDNSADFNGDGYPDGVLSTAGSLRDGEVDHAYTFLSGTSMAAPHVTGVLALMKSVNADLSPADMDALLAQGDLTTDIGDAGRDNLFGHGLVNAEKAVRAAIAATGTVPADNPRLTASSHALNFGSFRESLNLELRNAGKGNLAIQEVTGSSTWLAIQPQQADPGGLGTYTVTVDRSDLEPGVYPGEISVISTVNNVTIPVLMSVTDSTGSGDIGALYLLAIDTATGEVTAQTELSSSDGNYGFMLENIPGGIYELTAGTDADNDLVICDPGEACGAYLTTDRPADIVLETNRENLNFPVEYRVVIPDTSETGNTTRGKEQTRHRSASAPLQTRE